MDADARGSLTVRWGDGRAAFGADAADVGGEVVTADGAGAGSRFSVGANAAGEPGEWEKGEYGGGEPKGEGEQYGVPLIERRGAGHGARGKGQTSAWWDWRFYPEAGEFWVFVEPIGETKTTNQRSAIGSSATLVRDRWANAETNMKKACPELAWQ